MKTKWYNDLYQFWLDNLQKSVKKISVGFGSFLIVLITTCSLPAPIFLASIYGAGISFGTMIIMSIFGKNGNGQKHEPIELELPNLEPTTPEILNLEPTTPEIPKETEIKTKITIP